MGTGESISCEQAEALAGRICAAAAMSAQSQCRLLELVGEFDAVNAVRWWDGVKSLGHWLSYSKVREVTRVVGLVEDAQLCELASTATASQLARTVAGYRTAGRGPGSGSSRDGGCRGPSARTGWSTSGSGCRRRRRRC